MSFAMTPLDPEFTEVSPEESIVKISKVCGRENVADRYLGAISIEQDLIQYVTPDEVQWRLLRPEDVLSYDVRESQFIDPELKSFVPSRFFQCLRSIHWHRNAKVVFFTRSPSSVLASFLNRSSDIQISRLADITRIPKVAEPGFLDYDNHLKVPIVDFDSKPSELQNNVTTALEDHPDAPGVLVRGMGIFTWGSDVRQALEIHDTLERILEIYSSLKTNQLLLPGESPNRIPLISSLVSLAIVVIICAIVIPIIVALRRNQ